MFTFQLVATELDEIFQRTTLLRSAAFECSQHANKPEDAMAETKLSDVRIHMKELRKMLEQLDNKVEYLKNQS